MNDAYWALVCWKSSRSADQAFVCSPCALLPCPRPYHKSTSTPKVIPQAMQTPSHRGYVTRRVTQRVGMREGWSRGGRVLDDASLVAPASPSSCQPFLGGIHLHVGKVNHRSDLVSGITALCLERTQTPRIHQGLCPLEWLVWLQGPESQSWLPIEGNFLQPNRTPDMVLLLCPALQDLLAQAAVEL